MRDIRLDRLSVSSDNDVSRDSGYVSLIPRRNSRNSSPTSASRDMAASNADAEKWRLRYHRHNESGIPKAQTADVSCFRHFVNYIIYFYSEKLKPRPSVIGWV